MAAKRRKQRSGKKRSTTKSRKKRSGGVISGMRTGMKRATGSPGSRPQSGKDGKKKPVKLIDVLLWILLLALVIWLLSSRL